ncbi:MAG: hypothetical protein HWD61_05630 [Parachlamydiaceae bacterium]|nr:MAG: hypothetical protein HWD61_05630 [Parachlamydiaceae bacterium]
MKPNEQNEVAEMKFWDAKPEGIIANFIKLPPKLRRNILHLCVKIARPEGKTNKRKDGTTRTIQLTTKNAPWNDGVEKVHPAMLILRKREKKQAYLERQMPFAFATA